MVRRVLISFAFLVSLVATSLAMAGAQSPEAQAVANQPTDSSAIRAFVQSRPTPEEFRETHPDVWLILPGDIVSREVCSEYYRFIAELDADGRIKGGSLE